MVLFFISESWLIDFISCIFIDQKLTSQVHEIVGRINGRFGTLTAVPIHHLVSIIRMLTQRHKQFKDTLFSFSLEWSNSLILLVHNFVSFFHSMFILTPLWWVKRELSIFGEGKSEVTLTCLWNKRIHWRNENKENFRCIKNNLWKKWTEK